MKSIFYKVLVVTLLCSNHLFAQNVLLPYGQDSGEPWTAKYFYAANGSDGPAEDWYAENFNDSAWGSIQGPIATENDLPYYATLWESVYATYWTRRYFNFEDTINNRVLYFLEVNDNDCEAYLNGHLIFSTTSVNRYTQRIDVTENAKKYLKVGENVLAYKVYDYGGDAYLDCGLIGCTLYESGFDARTGWTGNFDMHNFDGNSIGYKYGNNWNCTQSVADADTGFYCLSANAFGMEYYYNFEDAKNSYKYNRISAELFINNSKKNIPWAFDEVANPNIYPDYFWEYNGGYVPNYVDRAPAALKRDMFKVKIYDFYETDSSNPMSVGVRCSSSVNKDRWAAWDNMTLNYIGESELTDMLDSLILLHTSLSGMNQDKNVKGVLDANLTEASAATTYKEKGLAYAKMFEYEPTVRKSIYEYDSLIATRQLLVDSLTKVTSYTSPATIAEANAFVATVQAAYDDGTYCNDDVDAAISNMNKLMERISYLYLDITVDVPGAMGDSILTKVEYFSDVYSIKLSGALNAADLSTVQRLTSMREIDMTDVEITSIPDRFFYDRRALEIVKLPSGLVSIGEYAFYQCYALKHIDFPETLTSISHHGFRECDNLQEVILPEGLTFIGEASFYGCDNNKYVKLPSTLTTISNYSFADNYNLDSVDFSEGLSSINYCGFSSCYKLDNIVFPNSLYYIGSYVFQSNSSLKNIIFNEGLYQIADNAFYDCDALVEVTLPSSLVLANASPFDYCDNLTKVTCLSIEPPYMIDQIPLGFDMTGRELYVPALSLNVYKQSLGWDKFTVIKPIDYLPENIAVLSDLYLTLPENIPSDYKPNVNLIHDSRGSSYYDYGRLTVNGVGTLSMTGFSMVWDQNYYYDYSANTPCFNSLVNNSHLRADSVYISNFIRNNRWNFISFPFDVKVSEIETVCEGTTNWIVRKYDGDKRANGLTNETWVKMTGDSILRAGEGYILQASRYIGTSYQNYSGLRMKAVNNANKNNIFRTTDITVGLKNYPSEFAHNRSWNLIGNPYPSFYDTRFMNFTAPITIWNIRNNTYEAYSPVDDSYILTPGEAFFVQRPIDTESITFDKDGRQTTRTVRAVAPSNVRRANSIGTRILVNLAISDGQSVDKTRVVINENATNDYETSKDAPKFMSSDESVPQLFSAFNGVDYAINERPMGSGEVNLSTRLGSEGQYSITLLKEVSGYDIVLEDKLLDKEVVLKEGQEYVFNASAGISTDRFVMHMIGLTTGVKSVLPDSDKDDIYYNIEGIRVDKPANRGVFIKNNKKVIVK